MSKELINQYFSQTSSVISKLGEFDDKIILFAESIFKEEEKIKF